jgi:hypothetical protein
MVGARGGTGAKGVGVEEVRSLDRGFARLGVLELESEDVGGSVISSAFVSVLA